jgi:hypothetical protein
MKLRASAFLAGAGKASPMSSLGANAVIIKTPGRMTWCNKSIIIANAPYTIESPSAGQAAQRIRFGEIARGAKGQRGLDAATGLPKAAAMTMQGARGPTGHAVPPEQWPSKIKGSYHTLEQLKSAFGQMSGRRPQSVRAY